ncbi:MAG: M20 family metallopeptidase [Candidatus Omnitrophota bacterium]
MENNISSYLEKNKYFAIKFLKDLIAIPTVNPPGINYEKIASLIETECIKMGLKIRKIVTPRASLYKSGIRSGSNRVNLICDWHVGSKKTLHINCHYDVVPASRERWATDPFKGVVRSGKLYGRGSEDMKGNIAAVIFALRSLKKTGVKPGINIQLSFTPDEETGGAAGLGYLVKKGLVKADYAMSEGYSGEYLAIGNKGVLWAEVVVKGRSSHASLPHLGVNSFERACKLVELLKRLQKRLSKKKTRFDIKDTLARVPTLVVGGFSSGGEKVNTVPGETMFTIDRRLIPEETIGSAKKEIRDVVRNFNNMFPDSKAFVKFRGEGRPVVSKEDRYFFKTVTGSIKSIIAKSPKLCILPGATDMRYFMTKGIPALGYSVKGGDSWHSANEFIYIKSLIDTSKIYADIITRI